MPGNKSTECLTQWLVPSKGCTYVQSVRLGKQAEGSPYGVVRLSLSTTLGLFTAKACAAVSLHSPASLPPIISSLALLKISRRGKLNYTKECLNLHTQALEVNSSRGWLPSGCYFVSLAGGARSAPYTGPPKMLPPPLYMYVLLRAGVCSHCQGGALEIVGAFGTPERGSSQMAMLICPPHSLLLLRFCLWRQWQRGCGDKQMFPRQLCGYCLACLTLPSPAARIYFHLFISPAGSPRHTSTFQRGLTSIFSWLYQPPFLLCGLPHCLCIKLNERGVSQFRVGRVGRFPNIRLVLGCHGDHRFLVPSVKYPSWRSGNSGQRQHPSENTQHKHINISVTTASLEPFIQSAVVSICLV